MMWRNRCGGLAAGILIELGSACTGEPALPPPTVAVSDSGGVRMVRIPPLGQFGLPQQRLYREYSTNRLGGKSVELFRVADALFLRDGSLVIANGGTEELFVIDSAGMSVRHLGGKGEGPGEFSWLHRLLPGESGDFFAWDYRFSRYSPNATFVGTSRLDPENRVVSLEPLAVFNDDQIAAVLGEQRYFQRSGERRDTVPLMVFSATASAPDTVGTWMGLERAFGNMKGRGTFIVPIGFARTAFYASNGERIAIGSTDSVDVTLFGSNMRPVLRIVAPAPKAKVTAEERDAWREYRDARVPMDNEDIRTAWANAPIRETLPGFEGLAVDSEGNVWIGEAVSPDVKNRRWIKFKPDGTPESEVVLPATWIGYLPGRTELLAVGRSRFAVLRRNRMDEESVEVWGIAHDR